VVLQLRQMVLVELMYRQICVQLLWLSMEAVLQVTYLLDSQEQLLYDWTFLPSKVRLIQKTLYVSFQHQELELFVSFVPLIEPAPLFFA